MDYVANWGDTATIFDQGPRTLADGMAGVGFSRKIDRSRVNGITFFRSSIRPRHITDGTSHTYMVGEKVLPDDYINWKGHLIFAGGWVGTAIIPPERDGVSSLGSLSFFFYGSRHPGGWQMAMCDGSVRKMRYDIDPDVHRHLANRQDGQIVRSASL